MKNARRTSGKRSVDLSAPLSKSPKVRQGAGVNVPHTNTTIKPSGTVSKLFALTEGAHLPSMREYIRWVQYRSMILPWTRIERRVPQRTQELHRLGRGGFSHAADDLPIENG